MRSLYRKHQTFTMVSTRMETTSIQNTYRKSSNSLGAGHSRSKGHYTEEDQTILVTFATARQIDNKCDKGCV